MAVVLVFEEDVLRLMLVHALQSGRCFEEKQSSCDELKVEWDINSAGDFFVFW